MRSEAITMRSEAIAIRLEAITIIRLEAIASRVKAIAIVGWRPNRRHHPSFDPSGGSGTDIRGGGDRDWRSSSMVGVAAWDSCLGRDSWDDKAIWTQ